MAETPPRAPIRAMIRVMIIDDASLVRLYYRDAIEAAGFAVEEALNGVEALEKLLRQPVDLLIVDINMPQMDGLTFLRTLRRLSHPVAAIPALVTSTEAAPQDRLAARAAGANYYLVKPIAPEILRDFVAMLCGQPA
jgi:two-component system chemotaxis response regulator CheY